MNFATRGTAARSTAAYGMEDKTIKSIFRLLWYEIELVAEQTDEEEQAPALKKVLTSRSC